MSPLANAAVHREDVCIPHPSQVIGSEGRAKSAAAIEDDGRVDVGNALLNVALDHSLTEMNGPGEMIVLPLVVFANIDEQELLVAVEFLLDIVHGDFADALLRVMDNIQKSLRVLVRHEHIIARKTEESPSFGFAQDKLRH